MSAQDSITIESNTPIELSTIPRNPHNTATDTEVKPSTSPETTAEEAQPGTPHLKLLSASFSFFVAGANDGSLGSLLPTILSSYAIGSGSVSLFYLCTFLGWFLCALTNSHAPKYFQLGFLLCIGAAMQLLSQALRAWKPPFGLFCVTFFLTGLGQAYQDSFSNTFVSSVGDRAHRWLGVIHAMYGFGLLVSPFVATAIAGDADGDKGWALFYLFPLGLSVLNLGLVLVAFKESLGIVHKNEHNDTEQDISRSSDAWIEVKQMMKMKNLWIFSLFFFFHLGTALTSGGWVVDYLVRVRHGQYSKMGYVPAGFYGGTCLGRLILVEPAHRFGERKMLTLYSILALAFQLVFWLVPNIASTVVMFSLIGFLLGPFFPAGISVASKLFPKKIQPAALGLIFVVAQAGGAIFPSLIGLIATRAGVRVLPPIVVALIVVTAIAWAFVPKVPRERKE